MVARNRRLSGRLLPLAFILCVLCVAACAGSPIENPGSQAPESDVPSAPASHLPTSAEAAFYHPSAADTAEAAPGEIIDAVEIMAPAGMRAWTVVYGSTGLDGKPVAVSGVVLAPSDAPTGSGYPVVAWAHGTTGIADFCAPSRSGMQSLTGLEALVSSGYVVTATDYEGLGTDGTHPYIIGTSEGRSVLDSIRAVQNLAEAHADGEAVVIGLSQGGHAALWAGQLAPTYAAELHLRGALAASPPTDLSAFARWTFQSGAAGMIYRTEAPVLLFGVWSEIYGLSLPFLTDTAQGIAAVVRDGCDPSGVSANPYASDPTLIPEWSRRFVENSPGGTRTDVPLLVVSADDDELVSYPSQVAGVETMCAIGDTVELRTVHGGHVAPLFSSSGFQAAQEWIAARFAGDAPISTCAVP